MPYSGTGKSSHGVTVSNVMQALDLYLGYNAYYGSVSARVC